MLLVTLVLLFVCGTGVSCEKQPAGSAISGWEKMGESSAEPSDEPLPEDPSSDEDPSELTEESRWFQTRGIVCGWNDIAIYHGKRIDYLKLAEEHHLNTFSIGGASLTSKDWNNYVESGTAIGIKFEFQQHMMSYLLPRNLFDTHPEYFRMNDQGVRMNDVNGCPSSEEGLEIIAANAKSMGASEKPGNHRYYYWFDDGGDVCYCPKCKGYSPSDQALMFENRIIKALREIDPDALLAHLAYENTTDAPKKVSPEEGVFLEFAPFWRNRYRPLSDASANGYNGWTNGKYLNALKENLKLFPVETAMVLEYWIDDSFFSNWNSAKLVEVPWDNNMFLDDLKTYASCGIRHITSSCVYVGPNYFIKFGYPTFMEEYADGLWEFEKQ